MDTWTSKHADWTRRSPELRTRLAKGIALDAALLVAIVAIGEVTVRTMFPSYGQYIYTDTLTGGHPKALNSHGLRDYEFDWKRPDDEIRLLAIGNSTTFGSGVALEDTYSKQLEAALGGTEASPRVINAGGQGRSTEEALNFLREEALDLEPSAVIFGFSPTMIGRGLQPSGGHPGRRAASNSRGGLPRWKEFALIPRRIAYSSYLYAAINVNIRGFFFWWGALRPRFDNPYNYLVAYAFDIPGVELERTERGYRLFSKDLEQMSELLEKRGVPLLVMGIPSRFEISDQRVDNRQYIPVDRARISPLDRIAKLCGRLGILFVDLRPPLRMKRKEMLEGKKSWDELYVAGDNIHLNKAGMRIAAEQLALTLESMRWPLHGLERVNQGSEGLPSLDR